MKLSGRIAVVDDNESGCYATARMLRVAGHDTFEVYNGTDAVRLIDGTTDLVVLDVNLPDFDGFEVCRRLRAKPETQFIPVIHLSATFVDDIDRVHGLDAGADGYLTHPVEPSVLVATVNAFLRARNAEAQRRAADAKLRAVFEATPAGIAILDSARRYQDVNPAYSRLIGVPREELLGQPSSMVIKPGLEGPGSEGVSEQASDAVAGDGSWTGPVPVQRPDGSVINVEWSAVEDPQNQLRVLVATDSTARRQFEQERERLLASERAARQDAEQAIRTKDDFLATLSHELRNPLSAILGWTEVLLRAAPDERFLQGLSAIQRAARLQKQLTSDLLDISGIGSGRLLLERDSVNLSEVAGDAVEALRPQFLTKKVDLALHIDLELPRILGDASRLQQVIWNLLSNAVKFTPSGGKVTLDIHAGDEDIEITVADTGAGIAAEFLPVIFDKFRQAESGTNRRVGGLGLGLTIVKHLVEAHGGQVAVESRGEGQGATFRVRLPLETVADRQRSGGLNLSGLRILVVDDDVDHRAFVRRVLQDWGAEVEEANDAAEALTALASRVPDLFVSDIGMPGTDGYALLREVRSRGLDARQLPAVALTAFSRVSDQEAALAAGYQQHLVKPVTPSKLLQVLNAVRPAKS
jgi:PAS domain S-box-containing protein